MGETLNSWYKPTTVLGTILGSNGVPSSYTSSNYEGFLDWSINKLVSSNTCITKTILGKDQTNTYNIYCYDFKPSTYEKTIMLTACLHGNEYTGFFGLCRFLEKIYTEHSTDANLDYLRNKIRFVVVPICNPWGFINGKRQNSNGVDLNRNSDYLWEKYSISQTYYKGVSPFSEVETQYIRDLAERIKDDNFIGCVDLHTITTIQSGKVLYYPRFQQTSECLLDAVSKFDTGVDNKETIFASTAVPTLNNYIASKHGVISCNPEWNNSVYGGNRNEFLMTKHVEWIGNIVLGIAKEDKKRGVQPPQPYTRYYHWKENDGIGETVVKSDTYNTIQLSRVDEYLDGSYMINVNGSVKVKVTKECTLAILPLLYQKYMTEEDYSTILNSNRYEEVITLKEGEHVIPITCALQGFYSNYNDATSTRADYVHFRLMAKTSILDSAYITGYKAMLQFTPTVKDLPLKITKINSTGNEILYPSILVDETMND